MKKIIIITAFIMLFSTISKAQENEWIKGYTVGFGTYLHYPGESSYSINYFLGGYIGYTINNNFVGVINPKYNYVSSDNGWHYLDIPALIVYQYNNMHIGLGIQYSQCIISSKYLAESASNKLNNFSAIVDFPLFSGFSARIGYALTPLQYSLKNELETIRIFKENPISIEIKFGFDLSRNTRKGRSMKR